MCCTSGIKMEIDYVRLSNKTNAIIIDRAYSIKVYDRLAWDLFYPGDFQSFPVPIKETLILHSYYRVI